MAMDFDKELEKIIQNKTDDNWDTLKRRQEENSIVSSELLKYDIFISDIYDFVNKGTPSNAIEPLIELFESGKIKDSVILDGIVRALTTKDAKGKIERMLLNKYKSLSREEKSKSLGWSIGNSIEFLYSDEYINDIIRIVKEKDNGSSRQMFVLALGKTKKHKEKAEELLIELIHDNDVSIHAIDALKKLKSLKAKESIKELSESSNKAISKSALAFLKKSKSW